MTTATATGTTFHALYEGTVHHRRVAPPDAFATPIMMPLLDLDHLEEAFAVHPLLSDRRGRPLRYERRDYLGAGPATVSEAVRDLVHQRLGVRPSGRVRMLAHLRTFGWCFNPVAVYWCEDGEGATVAQVLEVTNTPWHERHAYVLDCRNAHDGWDRSVPKALHVSPFLPMGLHHRIRSAPPGDTLRLQIDDHDASGELTFAASYVARRLPFDRAGVTRLLARHPFTTHRVSAGIYRRALHLRRIGATFFPHPARAQRPGPDAGGRTA